ncbi:YggT family protein [Neisseria sp. CCUG12390]|uniref:YggT family protein n=1 Tax=Neisseria sp. CCUG12390 TaxID=3392035 RepID=UPI003A0FED44
MRGDLLLLLADGLVILCLTRCVLQWAKLDNRHPLMRFCIQMTDWLVRPLHKISPSYGKWDVACVLAGLILYYVVFMLIAFIGSPSGFGAKWIAANFLFALLNTLKAAAYVLLMGLVIRMVSSFSRPYSELSVIMQRIFEPLLRPFAFLRIGRIDFSGSVLVLMLWFWLSYLLPVLISRLNLWLL